MNKKNIFIFIFIFIFTSSYSQENFENQKLAATCKIWGFLKYYHPNVASGKLDWDMQLIKILPEVRKAVNKEDLSKVYINWIENLGVIKECKKCSQTSSKEYFDKNFDLGWTQDPLVFSVELATKLKTIEQNRFQGKPYYVDVEKVGNISITNEKRYSNAEYPDSDFRLLGLFKFWNIIEYFYPYKYLTDENWNAVLLEMIPKFYNAKDPKEYHLVMLETVVKIDDSHGIFKTKYTVAFFGENFFPASLKIINNNAVINGFFNDSLCKINDLHIGDVIEKIDDKTVPEILSDRYKYISASNTKGKQRDTYYTLINGNTKEVKVLLSRDGITTERIIGRYSFEDTFKESSEKTKFKILQNNIGYVNFASMQHEDIDELTKALSNTKAIIFDLRDYPGIIPYRIANFLYKNKKAFNREILPDLMYPGKFYWSNLQEFGKENQNYYKGKVIILVNEKTQSRGEYVTMLLQSSPNAITVGNQTAGADGNVSKIEFLGYYSSLISGIGVYYPDGEQTQRKGIKIDYKIEQTIEGIKQKQDEILNKALELCTMNQ
ncbi:S41 family peptidase [Flavobacterium sp. HJJ]|uniref:S41 family peptidase n=1 Tax=Flavobacterium sp. HJJ TaxID=2783792 RepID=UPI00188CE07C|nr:S41 family peptidase [Flavobacterium sp. HJJ]MBF4472434.1 peptidase S41 [Flavobacterium sp. HJJ]